MNPKSWLSKYRKTSIGYITKMLLFYHGIGLLLMIIGTFLAEMTISGYKEPTTPLSIASVLSAGPIEETIFFGIPFYIFGNHFLVLATGTMWAMLHILNTTTPDINNLAYANWLFVIPSLFFSLRTWISGKGWFAIITHSVWNAIFFALSCGTGEISCVVIPQGWTFLAGISNIALPCALLSLTYVLYRRKSNKEQISKI